MQVFRLRKPAARIMSSQTVIEEARVLTHNPKRSPLDPFPRALKQFLAVRSAPGFDRYDGVVLALWGCVLAFAIHHHIAWGDEAQAWLIARDNSLRDILLRRLHYEGHPALWYLILWIATRIHLPYRALGWLGGALATPSVYLLLKHAPFPRIVRWLIPFTFFFQYQYAVIARSYVLYAGTIFALCIFYASPRPRPLLVALFAGLLANISAHGAIFASILFVIYLMDRFGNTGLELPRGRRQLWVSACLFSVLALFAVAVALPAPDVVVVGTAPTSKGLVHALLLKLMPDEQPAPAVVLDKPLKDPYATKSTAEPDHEDFLTTAIISAVVTFMFTLNDVTYSIARSNILAVAFLSLWIIWLWSRRRLVFAACLFSGTAICVSVWFYNHHAGIFPLVIIAATWITLATSHTVRGPRWIQTAFFGVSVVVLALQVGWTVHCIRAESRRPYDPGLATEQFLVQNYPGKRIAGFTFETVSTQPYAPRNLYINWAHDYFVWETSVLVTNRRTETYLMHPDVVVVGDFITEPDDIRNQWLHVIPPGRHPHLGMLDFWYQRGYRETHRFCGDRFIRLGESNRLCEVILESMQK
jgi:hypothetical protein